MMNSKDISNLLMVLAACLAILLIFDFFGVDITAQAIDFVDGEEETNKTKRPPVPRTIDTIPFTISEANGKNVILITLDTLRGDHVEFLGYDVETTPFMTEYSKDAVVFENTHSPMALTTPSHTTMLTGYYPMDHGVKGNSRQTEKPSLAEMLNRTGYFTAAFVSAKPAEPLNKGFQVFNFEGTYSASDSMKTKEKINSSEEFDIEKVKKTGFRRPGNETLLEFEEWIKTTEINDPAFIWVHYYDVHSPYISEYKNYFGAEIEYGDAMKVLKYAPRNSSKKFPERDSNIPEYSKEYSQEQVIKLYDGGVYAVDQYTKRTLELLEEKGLLENAIIIIAGDHGENLGERWNYFHGGDIYDPTTKVPLIIKTPETEPMRIQQDISLVSLTPTILEYLEMDYSEMLNGNSLIPLMNGDEINTPSFIESGMSGPPPHENGREDDYHELGIVRKPDRSVNCTTGKTECSNEVIERRKVGVVFDNKKLIYNGGDSIEFYDIIKDPKEAFNIYGTVDTTEHEKILDSWILLYDEQPEDEGYEGMDKETLEALRSLGYVG